MNDIQLSWFRDVFLYFIFNVRGVAEKNDSRICLPVHVLSEELLSLVISILSLADRATELEENRSVVVDIRSAVFRTSRCLSF